MNDKVERIISRYSSTSWLIDARLIRFILVGCSNFVVSFITFEVFLKTTSNFQMKLAVAQLTSYGAGLVWSFIWNRRYTFSSIGPWSKQFLRFLVIQLSLAACSALLIWITADIIFHLHATLSWLLVMSLVTIMNYYLSSKYVFKT